MKTHKKNFTFNQIQYSYRDCNREGLLISTLVN